MCISYWVVRHFYRLKVIFTYCLFGGFIFFAI